MSLHVCHCQWHVRVLLLIVCKYFQGALPPLRCPTTCTCVLADLCNGVQTIARQGQWLKAVMYKAYLRLFSMSGLLSMGDYPEGSKSNFNTYWAPRFQVRQLLVLDS